MWKDCERVRWVLTAVMRKRIAKETSHRRWGMCMIAGTCGKIRKMIDKVQAMWKNIS